MCMHNYCSTQTLLYAWHCNALGFQGTCKKKRVHFPYKTATTFEVKGQFVYTVGTFSLCLWHFCCWFSLIQKALKRVHIEDIGGDQEPSAISQWPSRKGERRSERGPTITPASIKDSSQPQVSLTPQSDGSPPASGSKRTELKTQDDTSKTKPSTHNTEEPVQIVSELHDGDTLTSSVHPGVPAQSSTRKTKMEVVKETHKVAGSRTTCTLHRVAASATQGGQHDAVEIPGVPDTSIQFQADWKRLRRNKTALTAYFKVTPKCEMLIFINFVSTIACNTALLIHCTYIYSYTCIYTIITCLMYMRFCWRIRLEY